MEFKDRVIERMKALSLSATEISKLTGVSKATVSFWVSGTNGAKGKNLLSLAKALQCSPDWLSDGDGQSGAVSREPGLTPETSNASAADLVKEMLAKSGKGIAEETRRRLLAAADESPEVDYIPAEHHSLRPLREEILIPQYDIRAAMGNGQVPPEYNQAVRNLVVREELLREKGVTYTSASALAMITGWGQSMEGTINDKDLVIVDRGVKDFIGEGIYVVTWHQELYIKRLMRLDEENYRLISDNQHYENQTARIEDVTIHAKVLFVWNGRKA